MSKNIYLANLNITQGFKIDGAAMGDSTGDPVSRIGDMNGDGYHEFLTAGYGVDPYGRKDAGMFYVFYGKKEGFTDFNLANFDETTGFTIAGAMGENCMEPIASDVGDFNKDGFADLIVLQKQLTSGFDTSGPSTAYIIYGSPSLTNIDLLYWDPAKGINITNIDDPSCDSYVGLTGTDYNGDGFSDAVIGASLASPNANLYQAGIIYVVYGGTSVTNIDLLNLQPSQGFTIWGNAESIRFGTQVRGIKFNNDKYNDLAISGLVTSGDTKPGFVSIIYGKSNQTNISLNNITQADGFTIYGSLAFPIGWAIDPVDFNNDGFEDLAIGAWDAYNKGACAVVYGSNENIGNIFITNLTDTQGFTIYGNNTSDNFGSSVSRVFDFNGDGNQDLLVSAREAENEKGVSYLFFGNSNPQNIDLSSNFDSSIGFMIYGEDPGDHAGDSVSAEDINKDGLSELIIGASAGASGRTYVIFGADDGSTTSPTRSPTIGTTTIPTNIPSTNPTNSPTIEPTKTPTMAPTAITLKDVHLTDDLTNTGQGFALYGVYTQGYSGYSVSGAGDVNGDGYSDSFIGGHCLDYAGKDNAGLSFVVFGNNKPNNTYLDESLTSTGRGFLIIGGKSYCSGYSVSEAGDFNNDGYGDLLIGARLASYGSRTASGISYVIFGKGSGFSDIDLTKDLTLTNQGFAIYGENEGDYCGESVSAAGDVNGDGYDDVIVGSDFASPNEKLWAGTSYVIFGRASSSIVNVDLADDLIATGQGFKIYGGNEKDYSGTSVSRAGDINRDGFHEVIIGARGASSSKGASYIIYGKASGFTNINLADDLTINNQGFTIYGTDGASGTAVSGAEDVNGDGYGDYLIGAPAAYGSSSSSGITYLLFGKASNTNMYLSTLTVSQGIKFIGAAYYDMSGSAVSCAGDINMDGYSDILIGAPYTGDDLGTSYVIFGKKDWSNVNFYLVSFSSYQGFTIYGPAKGYSSGYSLSNSGDTNNDGYPDIIIGAPGNQDLANTGTSYVIYGGKSASAPSVAPTTSPTTSAKSPTKAPTSSPTDAYINVDVSEGGEHTGTTSNENFVVDSSENTMITGGGGDDKFTMMVHPDVNTTITDFDKNNEVIDITAFTNIHNMDDLTITYGSAVVNLDDNQKVILQNLVPSDLTADNFIFASENSDSGDSEDYTTAIVASVVAGVTVIAAVGFGYYAYSHNLLCFAGKTLGEASDIVKSPMQEMSGVNA